MALKQSDPARVKPNTLRDATLPNTFRNQATSPAGGPGTRAPARSRSSRSQIGRRVPVWVLLAMVLAALAVASYIQNGRP